MLKVLYGNQRNWWNISMSSFFARKLASNYFVLKAKGFIVNFYIFLIREHFTKIPIRKQSRLTLIGGETFWLKII